MKKLIQFWVNKKTIANLHIGNFNDEEKAILPCLVYVSRPPENNPNINGFAIALGWWSWGIQLTIAKLK